MSQSIFISLKWKWLLGVLTILATVGGLIGSFAYQQLLSQQQYLLESQRQRLAQTLDSSTQRVIDHVATTAQQLSLVASPLNDDDTAVGDYQRLLKLKWADLRLYWDILSVSLVDQGGRLVVEAGVPMLPEDKNWLQQQGMIFEPQYRFFCRNSCTLKVTVPTLLQGDIFRLYVETDLTEILARFRVSEDFELAMLGPTLMEGQQAKANAPLFWGRSLYSLSDRYKNLPILASVAQSWSWSRLIASGGLYIVGDQEWALWGFPLDHKPSAPVILVMSNMSNWHTLLSQFQKNMIGSLIGALVLAGMLIVMLLWSPIRKLVAITDVLPLLAEHQFDVIRQTLSTKPNRLTDEVDMANSATLLVAERLAQLEEDVLGYTQELEKLAMLDTLTELPNRAMLIHELTQAIACIGPDDGELALLFLDLDEFKRINDTLGYTSGDELLKIVAARLSHCVRKIDTVFRLGGDEFIVLLREAHSEIEVNSAIDNIFLSLLQPVVLGRNKLVITTSIGVVLCNSSAISAEELIKQSELAMYRAKDSGRSNYRVYTEDMMRQANNQLMVEQNIGPAIAERQLKLFLQPIVQLPQGNIKGFEALIRWFHPERGLIMPDNFIPELEQSDAIIDLGNYVLEQGVMHLKRLSEQGYGELYIAVNLSARHFLSPGLKPFVEQLLMKYQVSPERLLLEITEESVIQKIDETIVVMQQLKELGVRIAIDDFGTGYSSLSYLKQLAFDVLKIDRCFTSGVLDDGADTHIVTSVIELAHNLGRMVVAEGVESAEQAQQLAHQGCELAQGYYYAKPLEEEVVFNLLRSLEPSKVWPRSMNIHPLPKRQSVS